MVHRFPNNSLRCHSKYSGFGSVASGGRLSGLPSYALKLKATASVV